LILGSGDGIYNQARRDAGVGGQLDTRKGHGSAARKLAMAPANAGRNGKSRSELLGNGGRRHSH